MFIRCFRQKAPRRVARVRGSNVISDGVGFLLDVMGRFARFLRFCGGVCKGWRDAMTRDTLRPLSRRPPRR
ncbi:hypothetical protein BMUNKI379_02285 [Burkholderia multivorans]|nr:hypothetical protein BMUNKI379_02285 [Burkholderia multivorans]